MERDEYVAALRDVLDSVTDEALEKVVRIVTGAVGDVDRLEVTVFPSQDDNGAFDVYAAPDGPSTSALDLSAADAHIFGVLQEESGWVPEVPAFGPAPGFDLPSAIVDTVADWIEELWKRGPGLSSAVTCEVLSPDGFGTTLPRVVETD